MLKCALPSNNMIGLESCSKKLDVPATQSTASPLGGARLAETMTVGLTRAAVEALNRAHPTGTLSASAIGVERS